MRGPKGRFWGSTMWQGYFVEAVILGVGICIVALRGLEYALLANTPSRAEEASAFHFPVSFPIGALFDGLSIDAIKNGIYLVALLKILISFTWMIVISLQPTMGVAWHRFLAFFNIFFKRHATGRTALGGLAPMTSGGKVIDFEDLEDMDEDTKLGVGAIEDFSWKGLLDFNTCTECGRCQSQCPAWNTDKPLSPKLLITALRDAAYAKAPYVQAGEGGAALLEKDPALKLEAERPLVGDTGDDWFYNPESGAAVIDPDVLWNCTSCGACVQQCPVDIEHVDHIVDMRRYAILVESNFPAELNGLFKGLENKGNPWNMSPNARLDWAKDLPFDVKVVGEDVQDLDEVEWLFWVGCAGAYEDRAKKTTRAVAELLDMAGVEFAVLGNGETCTGDPARRAGNEFVFQGLAAQNAETLKDAKAKKVVSTCAHCFNTLKNEYAAFGVELEVVHHTQLLNRLVREKKLTPVASNGSADKRSVTYHDPCYIGRHNGVYNPPRELLQVIPNADLVEMPRNSERSFCCGAGGARMWMEENIGERINLNRTKEAVETGADQIAVGCPFCRVMLSDGLTMQQSKGEAREEVEVLDVAQMLLASVKGETPAPKKAAASSGAAAAAGAGAAGAAAAGTATLTRDEETAAEPEAGDVTQTDDTVTETQDAGPLAKASGGSSLFDEPDMKDAEPATTGGGAASSSLFDLGGDDSDSSSSAPSTASSAGSTSSTGASSRRPTSGRRVALRPGWGRRRHVDLRAGRDRGAGRGGPRRGLHHRRTHRPQPGRRRHRRRARRRPHRPRGPHRQPRPQPHDLHRGRDRCERRLVGHRGHAGQRDPRGRLALRPRRARGGAGQHRGTRPVHGPADASTGSGSASDGEPAGEDPAGDSTTDGPTDRSQDDADTGVAPDADPSDPEARTDNHAPSPATSTEAEAQAGAEAGSQGGPAATTASGSGTAITPASEIPEGGSLFDLAEPEEEQVSTAAPAPSTAPADASTGSGSASDGEPAGEDPAGDSTTDGPTDRSQDDADTGVAPEADPSDPEARTDNHAPSPATSTEAEAQAGAESGSQGGAAAAAATGASAAAASSGGSAGESAQPAPGKKYPARTSMFDVLPPAPRGSGQDGQGASPVRAPRARPPRPAPPRPRPTRRPRPGRPPLRLPREPVRDDLGRDADPVAQGHQGAVLR